MLCDYNNVGNKLRKKYHNINNAIIIYKKLL